MQWATTCRRQILDILGEHGQQPDISSSPSQQLLLLLLSSIGAILRLTPKVAKIIGDSVAATIYQSTDDEIIYLLLISTTMLPLSTFTAASVAGYYSSDFLLISITFDFFADSAIAIYIEYLKQSYIRVRNQLIIASHI